MIASVKEIDALNITLFNSCINFTNVHVCNYCTKIFVIIVNTCGDILLPTRTKKTEAEHMFPRFHASRMRRTVWKNPEIMEANGNKRKLSGFYCFVFKFRLF